ncbi:MAG: CocE/NonD family hydrolase [Armatimonadota bacterium]
MSDRSVIAETVRVPMRDGVEISAHIYRPAGREPVPALTMYTPYRKGRLGAPPPFVRHGYAAVYFDIRGTGDSGGWNDTLYSATERQDGYDMIEWIAAQPWCTGNVGMYGISYGAVVSLQMAMAAPPHLKAIIARSGSDDPYTEWMCPGGQPRTYMHENYGNIMTAFNFSPPDPEVAGERWGEIWAERLQHNAPWGVSFVENLQDGPFWRERSLRDNYEKVRCAVYVVDGWADWYFHPLLRIFSRLATPKRALIGPWSHQFPDAALPGPRIDWDREMRRWFDYWLKGINTGIMDEPPVILFVREYQPPAPMFVEDRGAFRAENEWPLARQVETPLYLGHGALSESPGEGAETLVSDVRAGVATGKHGGGPFNDNWMLPLDQRADEIYSLTYTGPVLTEELEVTGVPRAKLRFTCDQEVALFAVKLCDVAPDGTAALVTKGWLNTAHRDSHTDLKPLQPGEAYDVEVELLSCAYRFAPGHRVRVMIAGADFLNVWPLPHPFTCEIMHGSCLVLPVVPPQSPALPAPALGESPYPLPARESLPEPAVTITRDLVSGTQSLYYATQYGRGKDHTARYTVDPDDPARVTLHSTADFHYEYPGRAFDVSAQSTLTSDPDAFHYTTELEIRVNGRPHFQKGWSTSVPRKPM